MGKSIYSFAILTLLFTILLGGLQEAILLDYKYITLPQLAPALAYLAVSLFYSEEKFKVNLKLKQITFGKIALAIAMPIACFFVVFQIANLFLETNLKIEIQEILSISIIGVIVGAMMEEIGWRSFLQRKTEKIYSKIVASVIVGFLWGMWHFGHYQNGIIFMLGFLFFTISASIIITAILRKTKSSLILSSLFHFSINIGYLIFIKTVITNYKVMLLNGLVWSVAAIAVVLFQIRKIIHKNYQKSHITHS